MTSQAQGLGVAALPLRRRPRNGATAGLLRACCLSAASLQARRWREYRSGWHLSARRLRQRIGVQPLRLRCTENFLHEKRSPMVGILVIAHAPLASALSRCAEHVYTCDPNTRRELRALDVDSSADLAQTVAQARALAREVDRGEGVLILTDAFGATPGNVAAQLAESDRVAVLAGVNLPMLLRAVCYRGGALEEVTEKALVGGRQGMLKVDAAR